MKKIILILVTVLFILGTFSGCEEREANIVSYNLSLEADNFNVVRRITVINCMANDVIFQMEGRMSIETDSEDQQLEVIVEQDYGVYRKHFIYLGTLCTYTVEDLGETQVDKYNYTMNYNPKMWLPLKVETVD